MIDAVDVETDAGLEPVVGLRHRHDAAAKTANRERRVARVRRHVVQARHELRDLLDVVRESRIERVAADDRERYRHALRVFLAQPRRDQHGFYTVRRLGAGAVDRREGKTTGDGRQPNRLDREDFELLHR